MNRVLRLTALKEGCKLNWLTGFFVCCSMNPVSPEYSLLFLLVWQEHRCATREENNSLASSAMSAAVPLLLSCWLSPPSYLHHVCGRQPSLAARQDPLREQVHRVFQEERAVAGVLVLCPQGGVLQNLQGLVVHLFCLFWNICGWLYRRKNARFRLWNSSPNTTHEEIMQVQHWTKERDMHSDNRGGIPQQPGPLGQNH